MARRLSRGERPRLGLLVLLKVFQQMHHFPSLDSIPVAVVEQVREAATSVLASVMTRRHRRRCSGITQQCASTSVSSRTKAPTQAQLRRARRTHGCAVHGPAGRHHQCHDRRTDRVGHRTTGFLDAGPDYRADPCKDPKTQAPVRSG
jgi:hypothetical protein